MYVYYDLINGRKGNFLILDSSVPYSQFYPSECIWMVPGTVDPMED